MSRLVSALRPVGIDLARRIFEAKPARHVDVATRIDGFVRIWPYSAKSRCSTFVR